MRQKQKTKRGCGGQNLVWSPVKRRQKLFNVLDLLKHFNLVMEQKFELAEKSFESEEVKDLANSSNMSPVVLQKNVQRSKKEALRVKKMMKSESMGLQNRSISNNDDQLNLNSQEEELSFFMGKAKVKKQRIQERQEELMMPYSLDKLITKPPYITVSRGNRIIGSFGHATVLFKRPVVEGKFYLEFIVREEVKNHQKITNKSSVRIGVCPANFNCSYPLGYGQSFAYKSVDGTIVTGGEKVEQHEKYQIGDVIGVCLKLSPPNKYQEPENLSENSLLTFYKNGKIVSTCRSLKQMFYCFAVSTYNYSQLQVLTKPDSRFKMPADSKSYFLVLGQKIPYKNLQTKKMFKI